MKTFQKKLMFLFILTLLFGCFNDSFSSEGNSSSPLLLQRGVPHSGTVGSRSSYYRVQLSTWTGYEIRSNSPMCITLFFCDDLTRIDSHNNADFLEFEGCGGSVRCSMSGYNIDVAGGFLYIRIDTDDDSDGCRFTLTVN